MFNKNSLFKHRKRYSYLATASKTLINIVLKLLISIVAFAFGFCLIMASNMGPAYLPSIMEGGLDIWIRASLLVLGLTIWLATTIWLIRVSYRYLAKLV